MKIHIYKPLITFYGTATWFSNIKIKNLFYSGLSRGDRGDLAAPMYPLSGKFFGFLVSVHVFLDVNNGQAKFFVSFLQIFFEKIEKR